MLLKFRGLAHEPEVCLHGQEPSLLTTMTLMAMKQLVVKARPPCSGGEIKQDRLKAV